MALPLKPPIKPQLALSGGASRGRGLGVRAEVRRLSRDRLRRRRRRLHPVAGRQAAGATPEVEFPEGRYVLDGELVILDGAGREEFDALQNRLHPAESRVRMLAEQTPALFRAFDLLALDHPTEALEAVRGPPRGAEEADRRRPRPQEDGLGFGRGPPLTTSREGPAVAREQRG